MNKLKVETDHVQGEVALDGSILLTNTTALGSYAANVVKPMLEWARVDAARVAIADRYGADGSWRRLTYGELESQSASIGQALLDRGLGPQRPLMLLSDNRIEGALTQVACLRARIPIAPITPAYSSGEGDRRRLAQILESLNPALIVVDQPLRHWAAFRDCGRVIPPMAAFESHPDFLEFDHWRNASPGPELCAAEAMVEPTTVAKILFTSGSTGTPKGAINSHGMLASNVQAIRQMWPFLEEEPPVVVDWLPWSHTFGGNFVFDSVLSTGGTLYIDNGKPLPGLIALSVKNSAEVRPTIHFNAPRGLDMVARVLRDDAELATQFFSRLGLIFFASAGLAPSVRKTWVALIEKYACRPVRFVSAWGTTETAPLATALNFDPHEVNNIGIPIPGTAIKLARINDRYEIRVKGPNVSPGYLGGAEISCSFDEQGFFCSGDIGRLSDEQNPSAGILIEGRIAEDFKLDSGTWVNVSGLRTQLLETMGPIVRDVVLSGANRHALAALVFLDCSQCKKVFGVDGETASWATDPRLVDALLASVAKHNDINPGGSRRISKVHIMQRDLDSSAGEVTEKGTVNQSAVLKREAALCDILHCVAATSGQPASNA
jgi:feruloyl-CoA synthase